ncbi:MAG TPA: HAD-IIIA family hydrolase [Bacteroides sp.]|nr:HAD-IIIA family hydrolase [Bacteroides sp.]
MSNFKEELSKVKAFVFDVDGVLSNAKIYLHPGNEMMRSANIKDGYAIQYAIRKGYPICIITGGNSEAVEDRFKNLGLTDIFLRSRNKMKDLEDFLGRYDFGPENILYMGDDLPDYPVMKVIGFPTCPSDAVEEIKSISLYISDKPGGEGCVRDVIEQVLRLQGKWMQEDAFTW